jgi:hypothetical protein
MGGKVQDGSSCGCTHTAVEREGDVMKTLKVIGWISVGLGAVAAGLLAGRELKRRYNFSRRTPYDYYSNSAPDDSSVEHAVGV